MRALICLLAAAVVVGCGSDTTQPTVDLTLAPTSTDVAGAFNLISANGTAPPFPAFATATADWTLAADTVAITATSTWTEATTYFVTSLIDNSTSTQFSVVSGTYVIADGKINAGVAVERLPLCFSRRLRVATSRCYFATCKLTARVCCEPTL